MTKINSLNMKFLRTIALIIVVQCSFISFSHAAVTEVEGQAGGGIVPWALLSGNKPTVSTTWVNTGAYTLSSLSLHTGILDWVELSYARQTFDTAAVGLGKVNVDVFGAKFKLINMTNILPTVALGVQHKITDIDDANFLDPMGADDTGTDFYLAATKVVPICDRKLLLNGTIRGTKANQIGILGFGSKTSDSYEAQFETSVGLFLNDKTVIGMEYRMKPDNIEGLSEDDWADLFYAYFPTKNMAIVAAYARLGDIAAEANIGEAGKDQRGIYIQVQGNF